ncbi:MAG: DNA repair protein RadC [Nanoarchaeota archaeon]|nr:DNA repair protein RadC [Nanoarchaeota archaeon]
MKIKDLPDSSKPREFIQIQLYTEEDKEQIINLAKENLKQIYGTLRGISKLSNIKENFELFLVAKKNHEVIGTIGIKVKKDMRICRIHVKKEFLGEDIESKLIKQALKYCRGKFQKVFLETHEKMNLEAFYKLGFKMHKKEDNGRILMERMLNIRIKDMLEDARPRERFIKLGAEALSSPELFAILLRTGSPNENVIDMSNRLINEHGLDKLFDCSLKELQQIKGIGPSKAMQILAMAELGKRHNQAQNPIKKITCAEDVFKHFHERLKDKKEEHFYILMLNTKNNIIGEQLISKGILDASIIHPREVFKPAIKNSASKIILVHNHPSGDPTPSQEDKEITEKLMKAGEELGIKVVDHIIIGNDDWWNWRN